jgi:putative oxidoreductase
MSTTRLAQKEIAPDRGATRKTTLLILQAIPRWLARHSITLLQISMGAIIFGFGVLKYFPGVSPAENLVQTTIRSMTFGLVPDRMALVLLATLECAIGLSLIIGRGMRVTIYLLVLWTIGVLSPAVLLPQRLFSGPDHAPTLEGQYVLKDIVLLTASLVIATTLSRRKNGAEHQYTHDEGRRTSSTTSPRSRTDTFGEEDDKSTVRAD